MIGTLITSKTRIKLLLKFFLNPKASSYLRALEEEFGESSNSIRVELNRFEEAGLLTSSLTSNRKLFRANLQHPLYRDIHNILRKYVGIDKIIDQVIERIGDVKEVHLLGNFARGLDSLKIELLITSEGLDEEYLKRLVEKVEKMIDRDISYLIRIPDEAAVYLGNIGNSDHLLIWRNEGEEIP